MFYNSAGYKAYEMVDKYIRRKNGNMTWIQNYEQYKK